MSSILIIDDQRGIRMLLAEVFRREGHSTILTSNGVEAFLEVEKAEPDCILLDMKLPGMSGTEILERLKKEHPNIPVIMMTAYEDDELMKRAYDLGALKLFTKPFDIYEMRDTVNKLFSD